MVRSRSISHGRPIREGVGIVRVFVVRFVVMVMLLVMMLMVLLDFGDVNVVIFWIIWVSNFKERTVIMQRLYRWKDGFW